MGSLTPLGSSSFPPPGAVAAGSTAQQLLLLRWHQRERGCRVLGTQLSRAPGAGLRPALEHRLDAQPERSWRCRAGRGPSSSIKGCCSHLVSFAPFLARAGDAGLGILAAVGTAVVLITAGPGPRGLSLHSSVMPWHCTCSAHVQVGRGGRAWGNPCRSCPQVHF